MSRCTLSASKLRAHATSQVMTKPLLQLYANSSARVPLARETYRSNSSVLSKILNLLNTKECGRKVTTTQLGCHSTRHTDLIIGAIDAAECWTNIRKIMKRIEVLVRSASFYVSSRRVGLTVVCAIATLLASPASAMRIEVLESPYTTVIDMQGTIEVGDTARLERQLASIKLPTPPTDHRTVGMIVVIESNGGNVAEALKLGRFLRKHNASISPSKTCASSCIFVLAAGIVRGGDARLVIHRPFGTEVARQPAPGTMRKVEQELEGYFREMNMPSRLVELIFSIAPEDAYELNESEKSELRLNQMDIEYAEELSTYNARVSGLSRTEYMRRLRILRSRNDQCFNRRTPSSQTLQCLNAAKAQLGLRGDYEDL